MDNQELREKIANVLQDYWKGDLSVRLRYADQILALLPPTPSYLGEEEIIKIIHKVAGYEHPTCVDLNYNCTTAKIAEQLGIKLWQAMCMMKYAENKISKPEDKICQYGKINGCPIKPQEEFYPGSTHPLPGKPQEANGYDNDGNPIQGVSNGSIGRAAGTFVKPEEEFCSCSHFREVGSHCSSCGKAIRPILKEIGICGVRKKP